MLAVLQDRDDYEAGNHGDGIEIVEDVKMAVEKLGGNVRITYEDGSTTTKVGMALIEVSK